MPLVLAFQPLVLPSSDGGVSIVVPIKCTGQAVTATIDLYIYEAAFWGSPGDLIASYSQTIAFEKGEQKNVTFVHSGLEATTGGRDVVVEAVVEDRVIESALFQDLYTKAGEGGGGIMDVMGPMMMIMMMAMVMPMITGITGGEEETEGGII